MELSKQDLERISHWFTCLEIYNPNLIEDEDRKVMSKIDVIEFNFENK